MTTEAHRTYWCPACCGPASGRRRTEEEKDARMKAAAKARARHYGYGEAQRWTDRGPDYAIRCDSMRCGFSWEADGFAGELDQSRPTGTRARPPVRDGEGAGV